MQWAIQTLLGKSLHGGSSETGFCCLTRIFKILWNVWRLIKGDWDYEQIDLPTKCWMESLIWSSHDVYETW
jgi:hypothetical protein